MKREEDTESYLDEDYKNSTNINSAPYLKRFQSAYIIFCSEFRNCFKLKFPHLSNPQITKLLASEWKKLDDKQKEEYKEKERLSKDKFEKEKQKGKQFKYHKSKACRKPTRFRTPYMLFLRANRSLLKSKDKFKNIEMIRTLSLKWNSMNEKERTPYIIQAKLDKVRYERDWDEYIKTLLKVKSTKYSRKKKTEKMLTDLIQTCNEDKNLYSHLCDAWERIRRNAKVKSEEAAVDDLIFKISKAIKEEDGKLHEDDESSVVSEVLMEDEEKR